MTTWAVPMSKLSAFGSNADAVTSSTPLAMMKNGDFATLTSTYSVVDSSWAASAAPWARFPR